VARRSGRAGGAGRDRRQRAGRGPGRQPVPYVAPQEEPDARVVTTRDGRIVVDRASGEIVVARGL
jgi:hypothetical protein